jgi:predicted ATPase
MITRIEIDGFKTFENFALDLRPLTAIVGPNASGKSNLFDAIQLISALAEKDVRTAMKGLRGEPEEFFRQTANGTTDIIKLAIEVFLDSEGVDDFGRSFEIRAQRLRYELILALSGGEDGSPRGVFVRDETCIALKRIEDRADYLKLRKPRYNSNLKPFIQRNDNNDALLVRQDGPLRRGKPVQLSLKEASRTALSTVTTAEFPHLYALRETLIAMRFLEINPTAARAANDRFESSVLKADASNLAAVLSRLREESGTTLRPDGALADIATDLSALIPSVSRIQVQADATRQYSFSVVFAKDMVFSSRVISDGTLRLLALLTLLNDPKRKGTLCFEEPENGVHEGRIPMLVEFLRDATTIEADSSEPLFQIILNTHSPKVMAALQDTEIVAADVVIGIEPSTKLVSPRTRMRTGISPSEDMFDREKYLVRSEVERLLQHTVDAA